MTLKQKVSVIILAALLVYALVDLGIQKYIVMPNFVSLERANARKDMQRCVAAVGREVHHLDMLCVDWSAWNDTYEFLKDRNAKFKESNLNEDTFKGNQLSLLCMFDAEGKLAWGQAPCRGQKEFQNLREVQELFGAPLADLLKHPTLTSVVKGITRTRLGPMLVASRAIITSDRHGPARGTLIMGRLLDKTLIGKLSEQTCIHLEVWPIEKDALDAEQRNILKQLSPVHPEYVVEQNARKLALYSAINSIHGVPALLLKAEVPRDISTEGARASEIALASIVVSGALLLLVLQFVLHRVIVKPLAKLTGYVSEVGQRGDLAGRLSMHRKDEIGVLADRFDASLEELQKRDRLLEGLADVGNCLMRETNPASPGPGVKTAAAIAPAASTAPPTATQDLFAQALASLGQAADAERVYLFENHTDPDTGKLCMSQRLEWTNSRVSPQIDNPQLQNLPWDIFPGWYDLLASGEPIAGPLENLGPAARALLEPQGIVSLLMVPILVEGRFWGFIGFDECRRPRRWTAEQPLLVAAATNFGNAIARNNAQRALVEARQAAEQASTSKSDFLAKMSHEIRTPMNGVIGMAHLLMKTDLTLQQQRYARIIRSSADSLLTLINDILDISKIEAGKLELHPAEFDLHPLVEDVAEMFSHQAAHKNIELACAVQGSVPPRVRGDADRLRQVLVNLVGNAVKFTETGEVIVRASLDRQAGNMAMVRFTIQDTGIGVSAEEAGRLFKAFSQADSSTTSKYGGTGLGLVISKRLVEMMGGQIGVLGEKGKGSTFWFTAELEVSPSLSPRIEATLSELRQLRVLGADDNAANRQVLAEQLAAWGFRSKIVSDGPSALEALRAGTAQGEPFGIVIFDAQMPGMSGWELSKAIKDDLRIHQNIRLIMTLVDAAVDEQAMSASGVDYCLTKPVRQSRLFDAIAEAVATAARRRENPASGGPRAPTTAIKAKAQGAWILVAEDNPVNQELAAEILRLAGYQCDVANNGLEAVDALMKKKYDLVLMDCQMPEMDGLEATASIRRKENAGMVLARGAAHIPIIALTANAISGERQHCLEAGMDGYVSKPIVPEDLIAAIDNQLLGDSASRRGATAGNSPLAQSPAPESSAPGPAPINRSELLQRCLGRESLAAKLLDKFSQQLPQQVQQITEAVRQGSAAQAAQLAHALKGAAANLAAEPVRQAAAELEGLLRAGKLSQAAAPLAKVQQEVRRCLEHLPVVQASLAVTTRGGSPGANTDRG